MIRFLMALVATGAGCCGQPVISAVVNAATLQPGVAPGSLVTIFGSGLASQTASATTAWPTSLGGSSVQVCQSTTQCAPAGLLYVSPTQINAYIPPTVSAAPLNINVTASGIIGPQVVLQVGQAAPGIFSESREDSIDPAWIDPFPSCPFSNSSAITLQNPQPLRGAVTDVSGRLVTTSNPVRAGSTYTAWLTGMAIGTAPLVQYPYTLKFPSIPSVVMRLAVKARTFPAGCFVVYPLAVARSPQFPGLDQINFTVSPYVAGSASDLNYPVWPCGTYKTEMTFDIVADTYTPEGRPEDGPPSNRMQLPLLIQPGDVPCTK